MLLETMGNLVPERMKRQSQSNNNSDEVKFDAVKNNIA